MKELNRKLSMKKYIKLAFAKQHIEFSNLALYQQYDLVTDQLYLYISKDRDIKDKKLYFVSLSFRASTIGIFQAKAEKSEVFNFRDL